MTHDLALPAETVHETGFHPRTSQLTSDFVDYNGYWLANRYSSENVLDEYWACRQKVSVMDLSALRKLEVLGPDAETLLETTLSRNVRRLSIGQVTYSAMCFDSGGMIADGTLMRLGTDNFRWICGNDLAGDWLRKQAQTLNLRVWVRDATSRLHNLAVQGPKSRDVLRGIVWTPPLQPNLDELAWYRFAVARIGDFDGLPIVVSRTGYTGELGYELWCHPKHACEVWDAVMRAGKPFGMAAIGLQTLDTLRIEAGLILSGYEFDDQTTPFEAGIGFTVNLEEKDDDFIGKLALRDSQLNPRRVLVGLEVDGDETPAPKDAIYRDHKSVGAVSSGVFSPSLGKHIALAHVTVQCADIGTPLLVAAPSSVGSNRPAKVVPLPFYDLGKTGLRA